MALPQLKLRQPGATMGPQCPVQRTIPFNIRIVNIEDDDELMKRFALEVPVVEIDGEVVASGQVDVDRVRAAVNEARIAQMRRKATGG